MCWFLAWSSSRFLLVVFACWFCLLFFLVVFFLLFFLRPPNMPEPAWRGPRRFLPPRSEQNWPRLSRISLRLASRINVAGAGARRRGFCRMKWWDPDHGSGCNRNRSRHLMSCVCFSLLRCTWRRERNARRFAAPRRAAAAGLAPCENYSAGLPCGITWRDRSTRQRSLERDR